MKLIWMSAILTLAAAFGIATIGRAEETEMSNWAYGALALDNADYGIGTIYYAASYFEGENLVNPQTADAYTAEELEAIKTMNGSGKYVAAPEGAVVGMSVYGTDTIYWFDAEGAAALVKHADPLKLDAETGALTTQEGEAVAQAISEK